MILDHVAQLAGLVEVAPTAFDADFFSDSNLHMGDAILVPLGLEQAVGKAQCNEVLHGLLAQIVVDPVDAVFREILRDCVVDPARRLKVVANRLFQHGASALGQPGLGQVFTDGAVHGRRGREVGNQLSGVAHYFGQCVIIFDFEKVHMHVAQARQKTLQWLVFNLLGAHEIAQARLDVRQVLGRRTDLARQRQDARFGVQQVGSVQLVQRREQFAQCQVAQGAEQGKCAGICGIREHDVYSFIKLK